MAATFQVRVQAYLGSGYAETTVLSDNLTAGAKYIADLLPPMKLEKFVSDSTDTGSGVTVTGMRVFGVHKNFVPASKIDKSQRAKLLDINSIYYADGNDPSYYIDAGKVYVTPDGGTVVGYSYPSVAYTETTVASFPAEFDQAVVLYAVIQGCMDLINDSRVSMVALTYATLTAPTAPTDSSYSYTDASLGTYTATTIGSLGTAPTYTKPTTSLTAAPADFALAIGTTAPTAPADSSYSYIDATLGTYTSTTIGSLGTVPTYTKPTISLTAAPSDFSFSIDVVIPTAPADASYSYSDAVLGTYTATTIGSLGTAPAYTKPTTTFSITNATTYIQTNEDLEKGQAELQMQNALLEQFGKDLYNELNEFNKENEIYKSTVQNAIRQAELDQERLMLAANKTTDLSIQNKAQTLNASISVSKDKLQKYAEQLDAYAKIVNKEVTLYKTNLDKWVTQRNTELSQYQLDIQNEQNEFIKELEVYKSTVQNAIRQAELDQERLMLNANKTTDLSIQNKAQTVNKDISLYKDKLQKFASQIDLFRSQVESEVQVYRANLEKWQTQRATELQLYGADIQNEVNEYQKELAVYQSTVQNAIRQAELDQERLMLNANKTTDLSIQNKAQTLMKDISLHKDKLEKYMGQIQVYSQQIQDASSKYNLDQQKYQAEVNHFNLILQSAKKEFEDYLKGRL